MYIFNEEVLVTADGILTTNPIILNASQTAYIEAVNVKPGDKVTDQQVLLQMNSPLLKAELNVLSNNYERIEKQHARSLKDLENLHLKKVKLFKQNMSSQRSLSIEYGAYSEKGVLPLQDKYLIAENNLLAMSRYNDSLISYERIIIVNINNPVF